ncbi:hypothetical protein SARC_10030 [Sphaeroforma arctica JP610]|uniref:Hexosyltransferase n=1 Tax=Sphaeroforma arctica JP610 TaxID=667725 RepID=A0A0L0FNB5_9EUKA|nr:hypothetical protein SARC_10030 [Sphaeroforma arctica JP610]KNC77508.1 hypothetical protein SARC_10030 [Sphaeroforma arctica JP610]|eukprot:XP_014151410.1 hypothetical protein SARC_10030 [Sphaeroforma arctica JP610]
MRFYTRVIGLVVLATIAIFSLWGRSHGEASVKVSDIVSDLHRREGSIQDDILDEAHVANRRGHLVPLLQDNLESPQVADIDISDGRKLYNIDLLPDLRAQYVDAMICSDERTIGGMVALVNSILSNTNTTVFFHLVTVKSQMEHLEEWILAALPDIVMEIVPFEADLTERLQLRGNTRKELSSALNFARFWMPSLFPHVLGRILYLDDDVIVLGDVNEMKHQPIKKGHVIAASADSKNTIGNFLNFDNPTVQNLGIGKDVQSFNAGVFVCDLDEWRKKNVTENVIYWMERNTKEHIYGGGIAGGASQPPMLIALHGLVTPLAQVWHVRHFGWWMGNHYKLDITKQAKLMHWNGGFKPWKSGKASKFAFVWHKYYFPDPWGQFTVVPPDGPAMKLPKKSKK